MSTESSRAGSPRTLREAVVTLRAFALSLPGASEEYPWGEVVAKVHKKVFVFFGSEATLDTELRLSVKLPRSGSDILSLPFAEPMRYGLGKSGWVSLRMLPDDLLPLESIQNWIVESYRAVAPKRLVAQLDAV